MNSVDSASLDKSPGQISRSAVTFCEVAKRSNFSRKFSFLSAGEVVGLRSELLALLPICKSLMIAIFIGCMGHLCGNVCCNEFNLGASVLGEAGHITPDCNLNNFPILS